MNTAKQGYESLLNKLAYSAIILCALFFLSCHQSPPLETKYDKAALSNLKGKRLCVISFSGQSGRYSTTSIIHAPGLDIPISLVATEDVTTLRFEKMMEEWAQVFQVDRSYYLRLKEEGKNLTTSEQKEAIKEALEKSDKERLAELLETIKQKMEENVIIKQNESIKEAIENRNIQQVQESIKSIIKENNSDFGLVVQDKLAWKGDERTYCFRSYTIIFDQQGRDIWSFNSKGFIISPFEFGSVLWVSQDDIVRYYGPFINYYPKFVLNLLEEDITGKQHEASGTYKKDTGIAISNDGASIGSCPDL